MCRAQLRKARENSERRIDKIEPFRVRIQSVYFRVCVCVSVCCHAAECSLLNKHHSCKICSQPNERRNYATTHIFAGITPEAAAATPAAPDAEIRPTKNYTLFGLLVRFFLSFFIFALRALNVMHLKYKIEKASEQRRRRRQQQCQNEINNSEFTWRCYIKKYKFNV